MPTLLTSNLLIEHLAHRVRNYANLRRGLGKMDRLTEKLNRAAGAAKRVGDRLEARADRLIAREEAAAHREDEVFNPHEERLGIAEKGMDAVERALGQMSNGDPLPVSGGAGESVQKPPAAPAVLLPEPPLTNPGALQVTLQAAQGAIPPDPSKASLGEMGLNTFRAQAEAQIAAGHKVG